MVEAMRVGLKYVRAYKDNRGKERIYYRRAGHPQVTLRGPIGSAAFLADYQRAQAVAEADTPKAVPSGSLEELAQLWLKETAYENMAASTQAVQRRILDRLRKDHGQRIIRLASAQDVRRLVMERKDTPAAANHVLRLLRSLFNLAVTLEWRPDNPAKGVARLPERQEGHPDWPDVLIERYRRHHKVGTKPRLAFELVLQTAQRKSDALRLGRQHFRQGATLLQFRQKKTGTELVIPVTAELQACVAALPEKNLTFLLTESGNPYTENGFYNALRDWCDQADIPKGYSAHGLRKARARLLAEAGATVHEIMAWTGHKTLAEVERYTRAAALARMAISGMEKEKARTPSG